MWRPARDRTLVVPDDRRRNTTPEGAPMQRFIIEREIPGAAT